MKLKDTHSTYASYRNGCRCHDCGKARNRYEKRLVIRRMRGQVAPDMDEVLAHVNRLMEWFDAGEIADDAGLDRRTVYRARDNKPILAASAKAILSVPVPCVDCGRDAWGGEFGGLRCKPCLDVRTLPSTNVLVERERRNDQARRQRQYRARGDAA